MAGRHSEHCPARRLCAGSQSLQALEKMLTALQCVTELPLEIDVRVRLSLPAYILMLREQPNLKSIESSGYAQ